MFYLTVRGGQLNMNPPSSPEAETGVSVMPYLNPKVIGSYDLLVKSSQKLL